MSWQKQTKDKPLFSDLLWSRPENKRHAGKLLIVGGNQHSLVAPAHAYAAANSAGAGSIRLALPENAKKLVGPIHPEAEFLPSTPSGSFSKSALAGLLEAALWSDAVLLAGDFGRNSETAVLLNSFISKFSGALTLSQDGIDYFTNNHSKILERPGTSLVINIGKLQKLSKLYRPTTPILHNMSLLEFAGLIGDWSNSTAASFIMRHGENYLVASSGKVSATADASERNWQVELAAYAAVWQMQQPGKNFEAYTTAVYDYCNQA